MQMKTNKTGAKILATVMVLAVALAGVTIVFNIDDSDAAGQSAVIDSVQYALSKDVDESSTLGYKYTENKKNT